MKVAVIIAVLFLSILSCQLAIARDYDNYQHHGHHGDHGDQGDQGYDGYDRNGYGFYNPYYWSGYGSPPYYG